MEYILLGVDGIIFGLCIRDYLSYKNTVKALKKANELPVNNQLQDYVAKQPNQKVDYAVIRGTVKPMGSCIQSVMTPGVTGVIQVIRLSEHQIARGFAGFWTEQNKLLHVSSNEVPFTIGNGSAAIEIVDGLSAEVLDLDVIHDNYEPVSLSFFDHVFGFFTGTRQRGIQTTEEILRDGSFITAVGELELDGTNLRLHTSSVGPLLLSTSTRKALIRKYEEARNDTFVKCVIFGAVSIAIIGILARRFYVKRKQQREDAKIAEQLDRTRQKRRAQARSSSGMIPENQLCVVCLTNPKEVICIPCGHVCMCEDCSRKIRDSCPVCRKKIESKAAAFIV